MCGERRIYLASPYSNPDPALRKARHEACRAVTAKLLEKGHCVFSPITNAVPLAVKAAQELGLHVHFLEAADV